METDPAEEYVRLLQTLIDKVGEISNSTERNSVKIDGITKRLDSFDTRFRNLETDMNTIKARHNRENGAVAVVKEKKSNWLWVIAATGGVLGLLVTAEKILSLLFSWLAR